MRGRPALQAKRIQKRAGEMLDQGERVNKSRIARELRVPLRTVFRVLPAGRSLSRSTSLPAFDQADFMSLVDKTPGHGPNGDCWIWKGGIAGSGYPKYQGVTGSHVALILDGRLRPAGAHALHSCDNKLCVRESHLRWGTVIENAVDYQQRGHTSRNWLTDDQVREVRASKERGCDLAKWYGVSQACICNIRRRVHRANVV